MECPGPVRGGGHRGDWNDLCDFDRRDRPIRWFGLSRVVLGRGLEHFPIQRRYFWLYWRAQRSVFFGYSDRSIRASVVCCHARVMAIIRSLAYIFPGQQRSRICETSAISSISVLGVPAGSDIAGLYGLAWAYLNLTKGGRTIYAIGSNREAARTAGLNVLGYSILPYVISGAFSTVAITFSSAQVMSIDPVAGTGLELDAIAAVVIGGSSLYGGRGSIFGTLIGVLIMVMIRNGLNLLNVSPFWQGSAIGAVIITAVLVERLLSSRAFAR